MLPYEKFGGFLLAKKGRQGEFIKSYLSTNFWKGRHNRPECAGVEIKDKRHRQGDTMPLVFGDGCNNYSRT